MRARSERSTVRTHSGVLRAIDRCIALARDPAACGTRAGMVSRWSVGEHLEHLLLSDSAIVEWLEGVSSGSVSGALRGGLTIPGHLVLRTGFIPRGKGRAPELAVPAGLSSSEIETGFRQLRRRFEALGSSLPYSCGGPYKQVRDPPFSGKSP